MSSDMRLTGTLLVSWPRLAPLLKSRSFCYLKRFFSLLPCNTILTSFMTKLKRFTCRTNCCVIWKSQSTVLATFHNMNSQRHCISSNTGCFNHKIDTLVDTTVFHEKVVTRKEHGLPVNKNECEENHRPEYTNFLSQISFLLFLKDIQAISINEVLTGLWWRHSILRMCRSSFSFRHCQNIGFSCFQLNTHRKLRPG